MKIRNYPRTWATATAYILASIIACIGIYVHSQVIDAYKPIVGVITPIMVAGCFHVLKIAHKEGQSE